MTTYQTLYMLAVVAAIIGAVADGVNVITPDALGLPEHAGAWAGLVGLVVRAAQTFLPPLQRTPAKTDNAGPASNPDPMPRDA